jgi:hypothetical protein
MTTQAPPLRQRQEGYRRGEDKIQVTQKMAVFGLLGDVKLVNNIVHSICVSLLSKLFTNFLHRQIQVTFTRLCVLKE